MKNQESINLFSYYFRLSIEKKTLIRSLRVAIAVGIILNFINHPNLFLDFSFQGINLITVILTFFVPFLVSTYSSVLSNGSLKPDGIAHVDAILKCKSCNKVQFQARVGERIDKCPSCKEKTRWVPTKLLSPIFTNDETLESLALFARYNPQPLFRLDSKGVILNSNLASDALFDIESPIGENIVQLFPELQKIRFHDLIGNEEVKEIMISTNGKFFNLVFKGVSMLSNIHVYGNDITKVVLNEIKIKSQAKSINESIQYSLFIQKAMLPDMDSLKKILPASFIFNKPRDIVSGDFYWINKIDEFKIVVVADSTGHGVPGALMSMIGISMLNEIVLREKIYEPDLILNCLRERIILSLSSGAEDSNISDGWDIAIAVINTEKNIIRFAGAYNPF